MMSSTPPRDGNESSPGPGFLIKPVSLSFSSKDSNKQKTAFNIQNPKRSTDSSNHPKLARRPHNLHHDDDESDDGGEPAFESVTGFDTVTGKTVSTNGESEKKPLTIPVTSKNKWRDRPGVIRPRGKNLLPKEVQALQEAQKNGRSPGNEVDTAGPSMSYGLSFAQQNQAPDTAETRTDGDQHMENAAPGIEQQKPLTEDELALRALVRESNGEVEKRSDLVIESRRVNEDENEYNGDNIETDSFRADIASRPESASLDQYNAIPVEDFGAALLRGMGWKDGQTVGKDYGSSKSNKSKTPHVPARHPGFLGIGAKDTAGGKGAEVEFGAWGKSAMRKGSRKGGEEKNGERNTEGVYMPVMIRNKKTGETITEEDLSALQKKAKKQDDDNDWKERRDRNLERNGREKDHHRDRDTRRIEYKDDDSDRYESSRNGSSRRDRSRSASDRHSRRRRYDDDDSDERDDRYYRDRYRNPDRERRSDRDRDGERDRDRKSRKYRDDDRYSSRHSSSNASSRHRDSDRNRDSHRRRKYDDR
ncbi:DExH-box splicing factor binding site-domain-containing protein [Aspergillus californicus]